MTELNLTICIHAAKIRYQTVKFLKFPTKFKIRERLFDGLENPVLELITPTKTNVLRQNFF